MKLSDLIVSPLNARKATDDLRLDELKESIKENNLISKIILRESKKGSYEIIAGQRRFKALLELFGHDYELPVDSYFLADMDDEHAFLLSISENTQRLDLSPIELNRALLKLNQWGYKDKEIAKILNIPVARLKRIAQLSQDINKIPEAARVELSKPFEDSKFTDSHWEKLKNIENPDVIKDVVDYILDKETPAKEVPSIIKSIEKQYKEPIDPSCDADTTPKEEQGPSLDEPLEYVHKGEMKLEVHGSEKILKVFGKGSENESEEVPLAHYMEYLAHPEKFKCYVTFKLKIKPILS